MFDAGPPNRLVCTSHAFLGGKLNLAHAAAVYLPASVDARLGALFGRPALLATGMDSHGRQGARVLEAHKGENVADLKDRLTAAFQRDLERLGIYVDVFLRTDAADVAEATYAAVSKLQAQGGIVETTSTTLKCAARCGDLSVSETTLPGGKTSDWKSHDMAAQEADLVCGKCGAPVHKTPKRQYAMDLGGNQEFLSQVPQTCSGKVGRKLLKAALSNSFDHWVISRDNYNGLPFPDDPDRQLYLWFPAIVSKSLLAKHLNMTTPMFLAGPHAKFYFAKNIVHYYARVLPLVLNQCFDAQKIGYSFHIRGFCDVEQSSDLLDLDHALDRYDLPTLRFFCLYTVADDVRDFVLSPDQLAVVDKGVIQKTFVPFMKRFHAPDEAGAVDTEHLPPIAAALWSKLDGYHEQGKVRGILLALEQAIQTQKADQTNLETQALAQIVSALLDVYAPGWRSAWGVS